MAEQGFDAEAYFRGKTIRMMVGFSQGGGTDAQARYFGQEWGRFIPGNPRIVVSNLTPVLTERNFVWNAKPDGFTLATEATPGITDMLEEGALFDMREVSVVGATSGGDNFWAVWHTLPYQCADTAMGQPGPEITVADGIASWEDMGSNAFNSGMAARILDLPLRLIHVAGDTGSNTQMLMLERGDVNSWTSSTVWQQLPQRRPGWVAEGRIRPFLDMSFTGVTMQGNSEGEWMCGKLEDYAEGGMANPEVQTFYKFADVRSAFSKNVIGPPGMDPNVLNALRRALDSAMNDPTFAAELEQAAGIPNYYTAGEKFEEDLERLTTGFLSSQDEYDLLRQEIYNTYVR